MVHLEAPLSTWCHVTYRPPSHVIYAVAHRIITHGIRSIRVHVWQPAGVHTAAFEALFTRKTTLTLRCKRQHKAPLRGEGRKNVQQHFSQNSGSEADQA